MATKYKFVFVQGGLNPRGDAITSHDRSAIRSAAATNGRVHQSAVVKRQRRPKDIQLKAISYSSRRNSSRTDDTVTTSSTTEGPFGQLTIRCGDELYPRDCTDEDGQDFVNWDTDSVDKELTFRSDSIDTERGVDEQTLLPQVPSVSLVSDSIDPFWTLSVPRYHLFPALLHHRATFLSPSIPDLDDFSGERQSLALFTMNMDDTAFLYSNLLVSAAHLLASGGYYQAAYQSIVLQEADIVWLRGCAVNALNKALADPAQATRDSTIASVWTLMNYEGMFGDRRIYRAHLAGSRKLLAMRGGIDMLHPTIAGVMKWLARKSVKHTTKADPLIFHDELRPRLSGPEDGKTEEGPTR